MVNVVIIGRNEEDSILPMLKSLEKFLPDARRIWILDRCSDDSAFILESLKEEYHTLSYFRNGFGRKTSTSRNYGLSLCDKDADVIFLDGDRYLISGDYSKLENQENDIVLFKCEKDQRTAKQVDMMQGNLYNLFYSCGFFIKRKAIEKIISFQGHFFEPKVEKNWGSEDLYLGDVCFHLRIPYILDESKILHGEIIGKDIDGYSSIRQRFKLRGKLNVYWY